MPSGSWSRIVRDQEVEQRALGGRLDRRAEDDQLDLADGRELRPEPLDELARASPARSCPAGPGSRPRPSASPGMTLYLMPGVDDVRADRVAQRAPAAARAYIGSQATAIAASARPGSSPDSPSRMRAASAGSSAAASSRKRAMTGVTRVGPGTARRVDDGGGQDRGVVLARHRAVAPRPADGDPVGGEALLGDLDRVEAAGRRSSSRRRRTR